MPDQEPRVPTPPQDYELVHREGTGLRLVFRYHDDGIRLTPVGLEWSTEGAPRTAAYADIDSIHLALGSLPQSGAFGTCTIGFRSGDVLAVVGVTPAGLPSPERAEAYAAFVRDLHARLGPADRARIRFIAGNSEGRQRFGLFAVVLAVGFFIIMPTVLLLITRDLKALAVLLFGVPFIMPALKTFRSNTPRDYSPDALPEDLIP